jgi:hypothetical protein
MNTKRLAGSAAATALLWIGMTGAPGASCGDRPGTPDMVSATPRDSHDVNGHPVREIVLRWRNTASDGERVFWDVEVTNGAGAVVNSITGGLRPSTSHHQELSNAFLVGPGEFRCYRIRARTERGTSGCVSAAFSAKVCARSSSAIGSPPR